MLDEDERNCTFRPVTTPYTPPPSSLSNTASSTKKSDEKKSTQESKKEDAGAAFLDRYRWPHTPPKKLTPAKRTSSQVTSPGKIRALAK
jgi:hypothetical protein